jgi:hypothetical protein
MFDLDLYLENHREEFKAIVDAMPFHSKPVATESLQEILKSDGFIFA